MHPFHRAVARLVRALVGASLLGAALAGGAAAGFIPPGGPSVRVIANERVEIRWSADFVGDGKVEIFENANGGTPIIVKTTPSSGTEHRVEFPVSSTGVIKPDSTYFFKVTHKDTAGVESDLTNDPAPYPSFYTGAQVISAVVVEPGPDNAVISWQANVIGSGRVEYGPTTAYGQTVDDAQNVTDHSITLTLLQPATTYFFRVSNRHAIDGGSLAEQTGSFTTLSSITGQFLQPLTQSTEPTSPVVNTAKNSRVVPVKVQLDQGGTAITDLNAPGPVTIAVSGLACGTSAGTDPVTAYADAGQSSAGTNEFRYDAAIAAWVYNLDTRALGLVRGNCYRIDVSVGGTPITDAFAVIQPI